MRVSTVICSAVLAHWTTNAALAADFQKLFGSDAYEFKVPTRALRKLSRFFQLRVQPLIDSGLPYGEIMALPRNVDGSADFL